MIAALLGHQMIPVAHAVPEPWPTLPQNQCSKKTYTSEPLAKLTLQGDFSLLWAKAGGAGGHFWHDTVTETNIITPAKWILPNAN